LLHKLYLSRRWSVDKTTQCYNSYVRK